MTASAQQRQIMRKNNERLLRQIAETVKKKGNIRI